MKGISRRAFLTQSALGFSAMYLPKIGIFSSTNAFAAGADGTTLVVVSLRGGADGLSILPPGTSHPDYMTYLQARPDLKVQGAALAGTKFALNPSCRKLKALWNQGQVAFIHGVGSPNGTRSHFVQTDLMELGTPLRRTQNEGYLNRAIEQLTVRSATLPGVSTNATLPLSLKGNEGTLAVPNLAAGLYSAAGVRASLTLKERIDRTWVRRTPIPDSSPTKYLEYVSRRQAVIARDAIGTLDAISKSAAGSTEGLCPVNGAADNGDDYGGLPQFQTAARLLRAHQGIRVVTIDVPGWDTHANMGTRAGGKFDKLLTSLDRALGAFARDLKANGLWDRTCIVVMSEFGRPVAQNGTKGLDHGRGGLMMVMGGRVDGGRVHTRQFSLADRNLIDGRDIAVNIDYRDVLGELLKKHVRVADLGAVFPDYAPAFLGVLKS